jgi:hypothetical protein
MALGRQIHAVRWPDPAAQTRARLHQDNEITLWAEFCADCADFKPPTGLIKYDHPTVWGRLINQPKRFLRRRGSHKFKHSCGRKSSGAARVKAPAERWQQDRGLD